MTENKRFCFVYSDGVKYLKVDGKVMPDNIALDLLNELAEENKQLKLSIETYKVGNRNTHARMKVLFDENQQLKQRIDRQAEQLDRLYKLIEEKDWRALSDIIDDFKRCEEQLQKEWRQYG